MQNGASRARGTPCAPAAGFKARSTTARAAGCAFPVTPMAAGDPAGIGIAALLLMLPTAAAFAETEQPAAGVLLIVLAWIPLIAYCLHEVRTNRGDGAIQDRLRQVRPKRVPFGDVHMRKCLRSCLSKGSGRLRALADERLMRREPRANSRGKRRNVDARVGTNLPEPGTSPA